MTPDVWTNSERDAARYEAAHTEREAPEMTAREAEAELEDAWWEAVMDEHRPAPRYRTDLPHSKEANAA